MIATVENTEKAPTIVDWGAEVRRVAGPAIVQSFAVTLVFAVDRAMLGHAGREALASMQIAGPLEWSIISIFSAFEVAAVARVGAHIGGAREHAARHASRIAVGIALVAGLLIAGATPGILHLLALRATDGATPLAISYLATTLTASPCVFLALAMTAIFQARGDTRTPLAVAILVQLVHIASNWILILGAFGFPAHGVRGAGWSTAGTFAFQALLLTVVALRRGWFKQTSVHPQAPTDPAELRKMLAIGGPAFLERFIYHLGFLTYVAMITGLGDVAMAANQSLIAIESICFNAADGFGAAAAATAARARGAGDHPGARMVVQRAARDALVVLVVAGALAALFRTPLLTVFGKDAPVIAVGAATIPVLAFAQPWMAVGTVYASGLRGVGRTKPVLVVSTLCALVVRIAATWFFAYGMHLGLVGIWLGSTTDWMLRTLLLRRLFVAEFVSGSGDHR